MSKRLYPILVIALMASLVFPRVMSPLRAQGLEERLKISRENSDALQQQQTTEFSQKLRTLQEEKAQKIQETVETRREEMEEKKADILEKRSENFEEFGSRLSQRFTLYKTRLSMIIDRLQSRLEKLEAEGTDTSAAQAKLDEATGLLSEASATGNSSVQIFTSIQVGDTSVVTSEIQAGQEKAQVTRQTYVEVMQTVKETIKLIREIQ